MSFPSTQLDAALLAKSVAMATSRHDDIYTYALPFRDFEAYRVCQGYGGKYSHIDASHYSIDFSMPVGTIVCAVRGGVVSRVVDHYSDGGTAESFKYKCNVMQITHSDLSVAEYVHLSNDGRLVAEGDIVSAGDPIAISGNTGWSRGPHLHFHVIENVTAQRIPVLFATQYRNRDTLEYGRTYRHPIRETKFTPKVRRTKRWTEDQVERARKWFVWLAGRTPVGSA